METISPGFITVLQTAPCIFGYRPAPISMILKNGSRLQIRRSPRVGKSASTFGTSSGVKWLARAVAAITPFCIALWQRDLKIQWNVKLYLHTNIYLQYYHWQVETQHIGLLARSSPKTKWCAVGFCVKKNPCLIVIIALAIFAIFLTCISSVFHRRMVFVALLRAYHEWLVKTGCSCWCHIVEPA